MMTANLRSGCGGRLNFSCFVACMESIWGVNPLHIISNIGNIMEDISVKWGLILLKHFSNPDANHPNNYWGNRELARAKKNRMETYRQGCKYTNHSWDVHAANQQRRFARFQGHFRVVDEFSRTLAAPFNSGPFQVVQPKANLKAKTSPVKMRVLEPRNALVKEKFDKFLAMCPQVDSCEGNGSSGGSVSSPASAVPQNGDEEMKWMWVSVCHVFAAFVLICHFCLHVSCVQLFLPVCVMIMTVFACMCHACNCFCLCAS